MWSAGRCLALLGLLLLALASSCEAKPKKGKHMEAEYNNEHARCEEFVATDETACVGVPGASNRENCVLACVSRTCFDRVFQLEPLEEGQHDRVRADRYKECAKRDLRKRLKKRQRAGEL